MIKSSYNHSHVVLTSPNWSKLDYIEDYMRRVGSSKN